MFDIPTIADLKPPVTPEPPPKPLSSKALRTQRTLKQVQKANNKNTTALAAQVSEDRPLTEQQREFCKHRARGDSIANAVAKAGFSDRTYGVRLAAQPNVKREIAKLQAEYAEAAELSRKDVMGMLKESYEMAKLMSEPATMVSAAREIGKMCGYYEPKRVQVDVNMTGSVKFEQLSDQELFAMIEKAAKEAEEVEMLLLEDASEASGDDFDGE